MTVQVTRGLADRIGTVALTFDRQELFDHLGEERGRFGFDQPERLLSSVAPCFLSRFA